MMGRGSIRHNNREFTAANVDRNRSGQNIVFVNEDLKQVYHELFDEALESYNAGRKRQGTRSQTTTSISGRASRRSCSMRPSSRSAISATAAAARRAASGQPRR